MNVLRPLLRARMAGLLAILLAGLAGALWAETTLVDGYAVRSWRTEEGLPQNLVTSSAQTDDGYLWFGTYEGLARFNGEGFRTIDAVSKPAIGDQRVSCLYADGDGTLWVGHESGLVSRLENGVVATALAGSGAPGQKIVGIGLGKERALWALRENGSLASLSGHPDIFSPIDGLPQKNMAFSRSSTGEIWVVENFEAFHLADDRLNPLALGGSPGGTSVLTIAAARDGGAWLFCDDRIRRWKDGKWVEDLGPYAWPVGPLTCASELRDGTLAVGTIYSGLFLVFRDGRKPVQFSTANSLLQNWVRFITEDRESGIWIGVGTSGIARIQESPLLAKNSPDHWQGCSVLAIAADNQGTLWVGTDGAGVYREEGGEWLRFEHDQGVVNSYVPSLAVTDKGRVLMGHFWQGSPLELKDGRFERVPGVPEKTSAVFALLPLRGSEDVLVGTRDGLYKMGSEGLSELVRSGGIHEGAVRAIAVDSHGEIWCGFEEGGLVRISAQEQRSFGLAEGLPSLSIRSLLATGDGTLWVGTDNGGLARFRNGHFSSMKKEQGLIDDFVGKIVDDGLGYFWISTHHGLQRVSISQLNACADGVVSKFEGQFYDHHDGLPTIEFVAGLQSSACRTPDGKIWFATHRGMLGVDPQKVRRNLNPPPIILESMLTDGRLEKATPGARPHLAPDHERIEFRFSGLSYAAPDKVRFKYRLEGIDGDWIDSGVRRNAFYSRLPAGEYEFRVIGSNNDNVWNERGASVRFSVAPFFWNTWWFVSLSLFSAAAGAAWVARKVTRLRIQKRIERMERLHAIEKERSRIARDIHDDVGAILSEISILSQPVPDELAAPERSAATMGRINMITRELTKSFDEIVWAVDPRHDSLDGLLDYMGRYAQSFLAASAIRCRLDFPVDVPPWATTSEVRHNLFLAFKEVLNNVAKHAGASEARISFRVEEATFMLEVRDNGKGFSLKGGFSTEERIVPGNGLRNMRARLEQIGGSFEIVGDAEKGTTVRFTVRRPLGEGTAPL